MQNYRPTSKTVRQTGSEVSGSGAPIAAKMWWLRDFLVQSLLPWQGFFQTERRGLSPLWSWGSGDHTAAVKLCWLQEFSSLWAPVCQNGWSWWWLFPFFAGGWRGADLKTDSWNPFIPPLCHMSLERSATSALAYAGSLQFHLLERDPLWLRSMSWLGRKSVWDWGAPCLLSERQRFSSILWACGDSCAGDGHACWPSDIYLRLGVCGPEPWYLLILTSVSSPGKQ